MNQQNVQPAIQLQARDQEKIDMQQEGVTEKKQIRVLQATANDATPR
jgi:hypothetical protein